MLGVCDRTFRRWLDFQVADDAAGGGIEALQDRRLLPASNLAAPVDEAMAMVDQYQTGYAGWSVRHYICALSA